MRVHVHVGKSMGRDPLSRSAVRRVAPRSASAAGAAEARGRAVDMERPGSAGSADPGRVPAGTLEA